MAKIKLTRKSYKRNIIVFGVMLFMGIALVSTGFATWVLSQNQSISNEGNVNVGIVSDKAIAVTDIVYKYNLYTEIEGKEGEYELSEHTDNGELSSNFTFNFDPIAGDTDGKVKWDSDAFRINDQIINYELLKLTISGKINNLNWLESFNISMVVPNGLIELDSKGYIELPAFVTTPINIPVESEEFTPSDYPYFTLVTEGENAGLFTIVIEFKWGEKFKHGNPSYYFDSKLTENVKDENGKEVSQTIKYDYKSIDAEYKANWLGTNGISEEEFNKNPENYSKQIKQLEYDYIKYCLQEIRRLVHGCSFYPDANNTTEYECYTKDGKWYVLSEGELYEGKLEGTLDNYYMTKGDKVKENSLYDILEQEFAITIEIVAK